MVNLGPREARAEHSSALLRVESKASSSWQRYRCFNTTHFLSLCPICEGVSSQSLIRSFNFLVWSALMFPSVYNMRFEIGKQGQLQFSCNDCYPCCNYIYIYIYINLFVILKYNWLKMLWQFQMGSKGIKLYIYLYLFFPKVPSYPGCHIILSRVPCAKQ